MHLISPTITIDSQFIPYLNKYLEFFINHIQSIKKHSNLTKNSIHQILIDLNESSYEKYILLIYDLCLIKSTKTHFQLIEKQHDYSKQFYKKIFNIQSLTTIEEYQEQYNQSIKCLNNLRIIFYQYEDELDQLKEKLLEQNKQISNYSTNLFQIHSEQNQIQLNIQKLKENILFEKRLYNEIKQIFNFNFKLDDINLQGYSIDNSDLEKQFHKEYINLTKQITEMKINIQETSSDLVSLQHEFNMYCKIHNMNDSKSTTQTLFIPTSSIEEIYHRSEPMIIKLQIPVESISKLEKSKIYLNY